MDGKAGLRLRYIITGSKEGDKERNGRESIGLSRKVKSTLKSKKILRSILLFLIIGIFSLSIIGCDNLFYDPDPKNPEIHSRTKYWYPNFTPDGKIVASKETTYYKNTVTGEQITGVKDAIVEMDVSGNNETVIVDDYFGWICQVSPSKNYVAFSFSGELWIYTYQGERVAYKEMGEVYSFDWSPDETKIVVCSQGASGIEVFDRNLNLVNTLPDGGSVAWKYNEKIAFYTFEGLSFIASDGTGLVTANINAHPENYDLSGRYIFSVAGGTYRYDTQLKSGTQLGVYNVGLYRKYFSPYGDKACGTDQTAGGIYIVNIDGTSKVKIK